MLIFAEQCYSALVEGLTGRGFTGAGEQATR
jgi:hypothetical protein